MRKLLQWLVEEGGVDVDVRDKYGRTLQHTAVAYGHLEVIKWLVEERGQDVDVRDNEGWTLQHTAAANGELEVLKWLVEERGQDVDARDNKEWTLRHTAAAHGKSEILKWLVEERGQDVDVRDHNGRTTQQAAASSRNIELPFWRNSEGRHNIQATRREPVPAAANGDRDDRRYRDDPSEMRNACLTVRTNVPLEEIMAFGKMPQSTMQQRLTKVSERDPGATNKDRDDRRRCAGPSEMRNAGTTNESPVLLEEDDDVCGVQIVAVEKLPESTIQKRPTPLGRRNPGTQRVLKDFGDLQIVEAPQQASRNRTCVVCLINDRTHAFLPCGHLCVCPGCAKRCTESTMRCPLCRKPVRTFQHIFSL